MLNDPIITFDENINYEDWCQALELDPEDDNNYNHFCEWRHNQ